MRPTTLQFSVGPEEVCVPAHARAPAPAHVDKLSWQVDNFRMIERHYFRDILIRSYDFSFGFCIPNSTNTWEV